MLMVGFLSHIATRCRASPNSLGKIVHLLWNISDISWCSVVRLQLMKLWRFGCFHFHCLDRLLLCFHPSQQIPLSSGLIWKSSSTSTSLLEYTRWRSQIWWVFGRGMMSLCRITFRDSEILETVATDTRNRCYSLNLNDSQLMAIAFEGLLPQIKERFSSQESESLCHMVQRMGNNNLRS